MPLTPDAPKLPYRIRSGGKGTTVTVNADGSLTVNSWGAVTLIEILPTLPTDRFTLEATIMHTNSKEGGFVGLYAAHTQAPNDTPEGLNAYVGLVYNDIVSDSAIADRLDPQNAAPIPRPQMNPVCLGLGITGLCRDGNLWEQYPRTTTGAPFVPAGIQGNAWHTLQLSVSPDGITGLRDGISLKRYTTQKWLNALQSQIKTQQARCPDDPHLQAMKPQFQPQAGIGFVVSQSNVTLKQVVVRPDSKADNQETNAN